MQQSVLQHLVAKPQKVEIRVRPCSTWDHKEWLQGWCLGATNCLTVVGARDATGSNNIQLEYSHEIITNIRSSFGKN